MSATGEKRKRERRRDICAYVMCRIRWSNGYMPALRITENLFVALGGLRCYLILRGRARDRLVCGERVSPIVKLLN